MTTETSLAFFNARRATMWALFLMGAPMGTLIPRLAEIKSQMGASSSSYGTAIALGGLGAIVGNYLGSRVVHWRGTKVVSTWVIFILLAANIGSAIAPSAMWFAVDSVLVGLSYSAAFVAMNSQGVLVEQHIGKSFLPTMHAFWSLGTVVTGVLSSLAAPFCSPLQALLATDVVVLIGWFVIARDFLPVQFDDRPQDDPEQLGAHERIPAHALRYLLIIALGQGLAQQAEISVGDWSSVLLKENFGMPVGPNGYAFGAFVVAQLIARWYSPRLVDRFGLDRVVRVFGYIGAVGYLVFLGIAVLEAHRSYLITLTSAMLSAAFMSLGVAVMPPAYATAAGGIPGLPSARALMILGAASAVVSMTTRIATSFLAGATSLPFALSLMGVMLLLSTVMSVHLHPERVHKHAIHR